MSKQHHVAVLAFPFGTHGAPLLNLVQRLAKALPNAIFSFFSTHKSNSSLFSSSLTLDNVKAYDVDDGVPEGYVLGKSQEDIELFLKVAREGFKNEIAVAEEKVGRKISCVIADPFLWFTCEMAEEMGVDWIAFWTSGVTPLSAHFHTDLVRQTIALDGANERKEELVTFIPGFSELSLGDLPDGILFGNLHSPFSQMLHKMGQTLPRASAIILNSFEDLNPHIVKDLRTNFKKFLNIGPFGLISPTPISKVSDVHGCLSWLDQQKEGSVAYIGFGTVVAPPPHELKALAEALEERKTPFLWSLKDHLKLNLPEGFLERTKEIGKIVPWTPQVQVLGHKATGVFIFHGGWNSMLESVVGGVPVIGRPFFGDQHVNVSVVERVWKTGIKIEGGVFSKDGVLQGLELVLSSERGKEMKERVRELRELAFKSVEPNGSSSKNFETLLSMLL
uniref:Glucosyltransferase 24 n=1 Tax=Nemophila menziesii TaxID=79376 RepID=A0A387II22_NEMME|nr:glucosyltransferase 24 [Nemophila menziesii]